MDKVSKMAARTRALMGWIRTQSTDSLIVLAVMIVMEIIWLPLVAGVVVWIYLSRLIKTQGGRLSVKRWERGSSP